MKAKVDVADIYYFRTSSLFLTDYFTQTFHVEMNVALTWNYKTSLTVLQLAVILVLYENTTSLI